MSNEYDELVQGNEYDDLLASDQKGQRLRATMVGAVQQNPDEFARAKALSVPTGIPAPVIARNLPATEAKAKLNEYDALIGTKTGDALAGSPDLARLAHDDTENMRAIERTMNRRSAGLIGGAPFNRSGGTLQASIGPAPSFSTIASGLTSAFGQGAERARQGVRLQFADAFGIDAMTADALRQRNQAQSRQDLTTPDFASSTARGLYAGGASTLQNLPGLAASLLTRSPAPALAAAGLQTELDAYGKYRARGASGGMALLGATGEGVVGVATELNPLRTMLGAFGQPGKTFAKEFLKGQVQDQLGEQAATILQDAIDTAVANPDKTWGDYLKERPDAAYQTALATLVQSGVMTAGHAAVSRMAGDEAKAAGAQRDAEALAQLAQLATASKLRARDPKTFQDFVAAANEGGDVQDIYLDVRTLQQSGIDPALLAAASPTVAAQIDEALATGGDLVIPLAEYATRIAGTDLDSVLTPHLRTGEDALSLDEAQRFYQGQAEEFQKTAAKAMEENAADTAWTASAKTVETTIFDGLKNTGRFTDDVNTAYATLMRDFYVATASRLGITPEETFARYPIKVAAERVGGGQRMEQGPDTPAFHAWFGDSKVTTADGKPLVVYHGTGADFDAFADNPNGIFFGSDPNVAARYSGIRQGAPRVLPVYLSIKNPWTIIRYGDEVPYSQQKDQSKEALKREGYDGIYRAEDGVWIAFDPTQIKSAIGNNGAFNPNDPNILKQGAVLDMGQFFQGNRAEITFGKDITQQPSVITLFKNADLSSFLHEMGHFQLEVLAHIASQPNAPAEIVADMATALKWFGVVDLATWQAMSLEQKRPYHEQFARGFEAYLFEGKAPSQELNGLFARFRSWLVRVYKSVKALNVEINPDIRGVFDRLLATDDAIKQAEALRGMVSVIPGTEALAAEATQEAITQLQKRSMRDMRWLDKARGRLLKQMQADAKAKRKAVEDGVRAEVRAMPVYQAQRFLKRGELTSLTTDEEIKATVHRLDTTALAEMYPESMLARPALERLQGMTRKDGLPPDLAAELLTAAGYPFTSGDHLVREILAAAPEAEMVEGMTDQRTLERYGDLTDPDALARAVDEAIHNDMRLKVLATELKAVTQASGPVRAIMQAARQYAAQVLAGKVIKSIKPRQYAAAETRAGKAALQALGKGDTATIAAEKHNQVLQGYLTKMSYEALDEIDRTRDFFRRVVKGKDADVLKTRDLDVVNAARAILASYGFGHKAKSAAQYLDAVRAYDPAMYDVLKDRVDSAVSDAKPFDELTLEAMRGLRDEVEAMWHLAERSRQMEVDGDLLDRQEVEAALRARIDDIGVPDIVPGEGSAITPGEERMRKLQTAIAAARRVESWAEAKDGGINGPFLKYIWQVIRDAADRYRTDKAKSLKTLREAFAEIPGMRRGLIDAPEIGYTFGKDEGGVGMSELMHALLHTGNESNKRKLLLGRNWATKNDDGTLDTTKWDAFLARMHREGRITKAHYDARQKIWDALEAIKPLAQKTHRDVFGKYFDEVTAETQVTPFGIYRGGYVPAMADTRIVNDAALRKLAEAENENLAYAFPATSRGFTKNRVEYNRPLLLDLRTLAQHIDKVIMFAHLEQPLRDVRRVLMSKEVSYGLTRIDPAAYDGLLLPWLKRTASQQVEKPIPGDRGLMRFFSVMRGRAGMAAMFANVSNTVQQATGLSIAIVKIDPTNPARAARLLLGAMAEYVKAPKEVAQTVAEASPYMATRMENEVAQMTGDIKAILLDPTVYESAQAWTARHAYFLQVAVDNVISPVVWLAAYNNAMEALPIPDTTGMTEKEAAAVQARIEADARRIADGTVRQTQGSTMPEDVSRIETGNAFVRIFSQFAGYFNMWANTLGTAYGQTVEQFGVKRGAGRMLYITLFGFLAPAWVAEAIAHAFRGGPDDEDKDGSYLDDWLMAVFGFGALRSATAMMPVFGQGINAAVNAANGKPYDDRIATAPAVSMIESAVRSPVSVYKAIVDDASKQKAVRDVATLISMTTGLPATAVARPIGYAVGVAAGEIRPENPADFARGMVSGAKGQQR